MPTFEILAIRPSWPGMCHVEFRLDGLPWRDGSVPAAVTEDDAALNAWLESRAEVYTADMHPESCAQDQDQEVRDVSN